MSEKLVIEYIKFLHKLSGTEDIGYTIWDSKDKVSYYYSVGEGSDMILGIFTIDDFKNYLIYKNLNMI